MGGFMSGDPAENAFAPSLSMGVFANQTN